MGLLRGDVPWRSKSSERSREIAICLEPFCQTEIAYQRLPPAIEQNVSWLEIAMEDSLAVRVFGSARDFHHQLHTSSRLAPQDYLSVFQTATGRKLHAEKRETVLALAHLIDGEDVWMIQAGCGFGFPPE